MACPNATQYKALALLALLVGHEGVRVHNTANETLGAMKVRPVNDEECEKKPMCMEDRKCTWWKGKCTAADESAPTDQCMWLPLWGDVSLTERCRISDAYMEGNNLDTYLPEQFKLLLAKTDALKNDCVDKPKNRFNFVGRARTWVQCKRRWAQVHRAWNWVTEMRSKEESSVKAVFDNYESDFEKVNGAFYQFLGDEAKVFKDLEGELTDSNSKLSTDLKGDPKTAVPRVVQLMATLLQGTEAEKEAAKAIVKGLGSIKDPAWGPEDGEKILDGEELERGMTELATETDEMKDMTSQAAVKNGIQSSGREDDNTTESSLIEMHGGDMVESGVVPIAKKVAFLGLVASLGALLLFTGLSLWYLAALGVWAGLVLTFCFLRMAYRLTQQKTGGFVQCVKKSIFVPLQFTGKAALFTFRKLWKNQDDAKIDWEPVKFWKKSSKEAPGSTTIDDE